MGWLEKRRAKKTAKKEKLRMEEAEAKEEWEAQKKRKEAEEEWRARTDESFFRDYDAGMVRGHNQVIESKKGGRRRSKTHRSKTHRSKTHRSIRRKGTPGGSRRRRR
jgi:hypothetical protein